MIKRTGTRAVSSVFADPKEPRAGQAGASPSQALGRVLQELRDAKLTDQSTQRMAELLVRFTIFVEKGVELRQISQISPEHARAFVQAAISTPPGIQPPRGAPMPLRPSALPLYSRPLPHPHPFTPP